jgi:translocator protein
MQPIRTPRRPSPNRPLTGLVIGLVPLVAGSAVGVVTNARGLRWYRRIAKPSWTPPDGVFGPVWTVLYLLMGRALVLVLRERAHDPSASTVALGAFGAQLTLNLLWSVLFFGLRRVHLALAELIALWLAIVVTAFAFARVRLAAGVMLLPYLAWTTFAGVLNAAIAARNPGR